MFMFVNSDSDKMYLHVFVLLCSFNFSLAVVNYCESDRIQESLVAPGMQFTKELSSSEYAILNSFKSLHCCAKGYRSIEWFKDGRAYPWPGDVSSFIIYPESANQTIYSQSLSSPDAGNYTCVVANDSRVDSHSTVLTVFEIRQNYMDVPRPTYLTPAEHFVRVNTQARLFCEAFVGKIDLPDASVEVLWERPGFNMSTDDGKHYQHATSREEGQVVGAYLFIESVTHEDLGEYVCSISNMQDQVIQQSTLLKQWVPDTNSLPNKIPWLKLQFIIITILIIVALIVVYNRFALSALLYLKLKFSPRPDDDGKEHDVLVCYSSEDSDFANNVLAKTLEDRYNYTVNVCQLNCPRAAAELQAASLSRRLLVVVSPAMFNNQWTAAALLPLFRQLETLHDHIICVPTQALVADETWKSEDGVLLRRLLSNCVVVTWQDITPAQRRRFWTRLRLGLPTPAPRSDTNLQQINVATTTKAKLSTFAKSSESLEVLV